MQTSLESGDISDTKLQIEEENCWMSNSEEVGLIAMPKHVYFSKMLVHG